MMYTKASNKNKTTHESATNTNAGLTVQGRVSSMSATTDSTPDLPIKQCSKCGVTYRLTTENFPKDKSRKSGLSSYCHECNRNKAREHYSIHKDEKPTPTAAQKESHRAASRKYYWLNRTKLLDQGRTYRLAEPEKFREKTRQWRQSHPELHRAKEHRRRALKQGSEGYELPFHEQAQLKRQKGKCYYCGGKLTEYHIEHVTPLSRGGTDHPDNKVLACPTCNLSKRDKLPSEWSKGGRLL